VVVKTYWFKAFSNFYEARTRLVNISTNRNTGFWSSLLPQPFAFACQYSGLSHHSCRTLSRLFTLLKKWVPIPVFARSKVWVCGRLLAGIVGSNPVRAWMFVSCECCVFSGRVHCDGLITRPKESYRVPCVWVSS